MKLYIMRHGEAVHYHEAGDKYRPLTATGKQEVTTAGQHLAALGVVFDGVIHSPYVRATQTWEQLAPLLPVPGFVVSTPQVTPLGDPLAVHDYLWYELNMAKQDCLLVVSHLPLVGDLVQHYCPEQHPLFYTAAISCVEVNVDTGQGQLLWHHHGH